MNPFPGSLGMGITSMIERIIIFAIIFSFSNGDAFTQGFNRTYEVSPNGSRFTSMLVKNDTLIAIGIARDSLPPNRIGVFWMKMDTLGNILKERFYTAEDDLSSTHKQGFIRTKNQSGYALVGTTTTYDVYFIQLSEEGDLVLFEQYPKEDASRLLWYRIIETESGFLVGGVRNETGSNSVALIAKIDYAGELQWEKTYDGGNSLQGLADFIKLNDNLYVLSMGSIQEVSGSPNLDQGFTHLFGVDSLGNTEWYWETGLDTDETGATGLTRLANGDWVYLTSETIYDDYLYTYVGQNMLIRRDSNMDVVWQRDFGQQVLEGGGIDMIQANNSDLLFTGFLWDVNVETGITGRYSLSGEECWLRQDTGFYFPNTQVDNELYCLAEISSGSIFTVGSTIDWQESKEYSWILKISPNGCIDTINCKSTSLKEINSTVGLIAISVKAFPSPAKRFMKFESHVLMDGLLNVYDAMGQLVERIDWSGNMLELDVSVYPTGVYFYTLLGSDFKVSGTFQVIH